LGCFLAESLNAKVTAVYVTGDFTWKELRNIYAFDDLKWPGSGRVGKEAMAAAEGRKASLAKETLESTEKMCSDRGIRCEKMQLSCISPLQGALKVAEEKQCDVIVTSTQLHGLTKPRFAVKQAKVNGGSKIPVLLHHAV
jgi:nucleotide-binding universal stress UspA family protein